MVGIAVFLDAHLAQHLTDDDLDVLIADVNALHTVSREHFQRDVRLHTLDALDLEDVVGVDRTLDQRISRRHALTLGNGQTCAVIDRIGHGLAVIAGDSDFALVLVSDPGGTRRRSP